MNDPDLAVVEFVLTAGWYSENRDLEPDDLPPAYRAVFWSGEGIERPLSATTTTAREATGVDRPWEAVSGLLFTDRDEFAGTISFTDEEMAEEWFLERVDADHLHDNPVLAAEYEDEFDDLSYEAARSDNRPVRADRVWIDNLLDEYFEDEEDEEMLDLVDVRAPEEVEMTMDQLVLTPDQEEEILKIVKAIEHRDYLADIGLREIGKLLFVGPPGTGKTSVARALAHQLDLPFVEVKLSMITSQYLGEREVEVVGQRAGDGGLAGARRADEQQLPDLTEPDLGEVVAVLDGLDDLVDLVLLVGGEHEVLQRHLDLLGGADLDEVEHLLFVLVEHLLEQRDRKSTRLNSSHITRSRIPSSA